MDHKALSEALKTADEDVLREILREAEARLNAQLQTALAADARAMTFLGFLMALVTLLLGAGLSALVREDPNVTVAAILFFGAIGPAIACLPAYRAAKPIPFRMAGNDPDQWVEDIKRQIKFTEALAEQIAYYDGMLKKNRENMLTSSEFLADSAKLTTVWLFVYGVIAVYLLLGVAV